MCKEKSIHSTTTLSPSSPLSSSPSSSSCKLEYYEALEWSWRERGGVRSGKVKGKGSQRQSTLLSLSINQLSYKRCTTLPAPPAAAAATLHSLPGFPVSPGSPVPQAKLVQLVAVHAMFHRHPQQTDKRTEQNRGGRGREKRTGESTTKAGALTPLLLSR